MAKTTKTATASMTSIKARNDKATSVVRDAFVEFLVKQTTENAGAFSKSFKGEDFINYAPRNGITKKPYNERNHALLFCIAIARHDPRFCTFKQASSAEKSVKKGTHGFLALSNVPMFKEKNEEKNSYVIRPAKTLEERAQSIFSVKKWFYVFNFTDIDGVEPFEVDTKINYNAEKNASFARIDALIKKYGIEVRHEDQRLNPNEMTAFYMPSKHYIAIFDKKAFRSQTTYYATLLHELAHSTQKALKRDLSYDDEELVAEISSLMLSMQFKLDFDCEHFKNAFAYLNKYVKKDPEIRRKKIEEAVIEAEKAINYLKKFDSELADDVVASANTGVELETIEQTENALNPEPQKDPAPVQTDLFGDAPTPKTKKVRAKKGAATTAKSKQSKSKIAARSTLETMSKKASKKKAPTENDDLIKKIMALSPEQRELIKSLLG